MFIATTFPISKLWNHARCPSADEWIKKMWYIYTMEFYSTIKDKLISFVLLSSWHQTSSG
jgi:hypothetical protein